MAESDRGQALGGTRRILGCEDLLQLLKRTPDSLDTKQVPENGLNLMELKVQNNASQKLEKRTMSQTRKMKMYL